MTKGTGTIPRRPLGTTGADVSAVGLGGYHLGSARTPREATRIVHAALDAGIDFFDNAWEYHEGESEKRLGAALEGRRHQAFLMTKVCTHGRDAKVAMKQLEQSLKRLKTDYLDLWQIHEVVWEDDPEHHFAKGGVIEALDRAKKEGKVRFTGFTGHKSPQIHRKMLDQGYPFDTCQLPLNCFDASFRSFEEEILPLLNERGIAPIGMKSLGGTGMPVKKKSITAQEGIRYAMSLPIATLVSGIESMKVLEQNVAIARDFKPMTVREMKQLRKRVEDDAKGGRFELYKISMLHDADEGRKTHRVPSMKELTL